MTVILRLFAQIVIAWLTLAGMAVIGHWTVRNDSFLDYRWWVFPTGFIGMGCVLVGGVLCSVALWSILWVKE